MVGTVPASAKYVAEFVGTLALVFTVGCNVLAGTQVFGVISIASVLMVMIYGLGGVSGGHFNPAVTFAIKLLDESFDYATMGIYMACQVAGGLTGALMYWLLFGYQSFNLTPNGWLRSGVCELLYTCMLVFAVLNTACAKKNQPNEYYGLTIAFTVVAGGYASANLSGACFNPAVAIAVDVISANQGLFWCLPYTLFELAGSALAFGLYKAMRPEEFGGVSDNKCKYLAEFIGTFYLCLTVGLNVLVGLDKTAAVFSIACSLMCMIYCVGSVSGAHLNPAVTAAIFISGRNKIEASDVGAYVGAQLAGGLVGGLTYMLLTGSSFGLEPKPEYLWAPVGVAEAFFTFVLAFTVLCVATTQKALGHFFGLAIGFCVIVGGYAVGSISGGVFNPAVAFTVDTSNLIHKGLGAGWHRCLTYSGFQLAGAAAAAGAFMGTHVTEYGKSKEEAGIAKSTEQYGSA